MRKSLVRTLCFSVVATMLAGVVGCTHRNEDINYVVDPYWEKEYFNPDDTWYYRGTVVDTPSNQGIFGNVGEGDWLLLERLRWEITETMLIGWRDYAAAPGTEGDLDEYADDVYKGAPVAMFPIISHFDIQRGYNSGTGEETNVISENYSDRPWYERSYMRVDWAHNVVPTWRTHIVLNLVGDAYYVQNNEPGNPKRFRFQDDYFEVTTRANWEPDIYSFVGYYGLPYAYDTSAVLMDIRHSFSKMDKAANEDFEIVHMPQSVVLTDADGNEVRDAEGFAERVPIQSRFGLYSTFGRRAWDPNRGVTDSGRQFHATVFNIWERSKRDDGTPIPMEERTPTPIEYFTNVNHPKQLLNASKERIGGSWNNAFKEVVFHAQAGQFATLDDVPDMFIVHENSCNPSNIENELADLRPDLRQLVTAAAATDTGFNGRIDSVIERYEEANDADNPAPFTVRQQQETRALEDLERICSAIEYYTDPLISRDPSIAQFNYQRSGDVRFNMLNLIMHETKAGWLGYGPMLGDPVTGETVQATANIAMTGLDTYAERINQMIDLMNGVIPLGDHLYGYDIQAYLAQKLAASQQLTTGGVSDEVLQSMRARFGQLQSAGDEAMIESSPGAMESRLQRVVGTNLEHQLVHPQDLALFGGVNPNGNAALTMDESMMEMVSPARDNRMFRTAERDQLIQRLGENAMDTVEFVDRFAFGIATLLKDVPSRRERFERIREQVYVAVQLHEVGHNVGLFHNFEASTDALNYGERFWDLQQLDADMNVARGEVDAATLATLDACITQQDEMNTRFQQDFTFTTQECLRQTEGQYASIMDYHGTWNGDLNGLGPYDKAAIKFAYGKLLEVFPAANLAVDPATVDTKQWTYYNDWRDIAGELLVSADAINEREHIKFEWGPVTTNQRPPANTVPYRFCPGGYYGNTPWCQVFDFGPDMRTNAAFNRTRYDQYYFFSHFSRDRLVEFNDGVNAALNSDVRVMADFVKKMQWYYFMSVTDPEFIGSYAEEDFLAVTIEGLNLMAEVIGTPRSGSFTTVPLSQVMGLTNEPVTADRLAPTDIMTSWNPQTQCNAAFIADTDAAGDPISGKNGFSAGRIGLGDGRPFFLGLTDDYEEYFVRYVGTYWSKQYALLMMGANNAWFPRTTRDVDPRFFDISYYRLFPREIEGLFHKLVTDDFASLGPVMDDTGAYERRMLIDPDTGLSPELSGRYDGMNRVLPTISFNHQFFGIWYAHALMSSQFDDQRDFSKSFKVAVEGADDDFGAFDAAISAAIGRGQDPSEVVAEFVHPVSGVRYRGLNNGDFPIAFDLVGRMNVLKERFDLLDACVADPALAAVEPYCHCALNLEERPTGTFCADLYLAPPGSTFCGQYDLENRRESALERLEDYVDYVNSVRDFNRLFESW